jgi:hypothetical protein
MAENYAATALAEQRSAAIMATGRPSKTTLTLDAAIRPPIGDGPRRWVLYSGMPGSGEILYDDGASATTESKSISFDSSVDPTGSVGFYLLKG